MRGTLSPASRRAAACAGLAGAALTVTACGGQAARVALPPKAGATTIAPVAAARQASTAQQAVAVAYRGYWQAYAAAMTSGSAARAESILARYSTSSGIPQLIRSLKIVWKAHEVAYGGAVTHVLNVHVSGRRALLHDCLDLSHFGVLDQKTGRVVPTSFGLPRLNYYISLVRSAGRWKVASMQPVEVPCTP